MHSHASWLVVFAAMVAALAPPVSASDPTTDQPATIAMRIPATELVNVTLPDWVADRASDYGAFVWVALTPAEHSELRSLGVEMEERTACFTLHLGGQTFDPAEAEPDLPLGWAEVRTDGEDLHLVQFAGPIRADWLGDLEARGLNVVRYVYPSTYIVWGETGARNAASDIDAVRWTGPFAPAYRLLPQWRDLPDEPLDVDVLVYRGADVETAIDGLIKLGAGLRGRSVLTDTFEEVGLTVSGAALQAAAHIPGVYSIQPVPTDGGLRGELSNQVCVNNIDQDDFAYPGYHDWLADVGLTGAGVIMANVDSGVQNDHPDLVNRLIGCVGDTCGGQLEGSHGTHTAGIMAADGASNTFDDLGFLRGLGIAPGAALVEQVYSPWYLQEDGMRLLIAESYRNGASLSSNSWGPSDEPHGYDNDTMQVDIGIRDADPDEPGNQPFSYVLAIENGHGGVSTQGTPDEAKNAFTIGSTIMQDVFGQQYQNINDISWNSAHGPALDGRTIPHMVAPGCMAESSNVGGGHVMKCGTSIAAPHVAGAVALFIERYRNLPDYTEDPSPALIKAAFLPVAHDLAGNEDADNVILGHPFDSKQGWGRMNLEAVVDPPLNVLYFDNPVIFDNTGEIWTIDVAPADPNEPMRLMLVWTDAAGHGLGGSTPAWNNDLDLVVDVNGDTYRGNSFGGDGWSITGGVADGMNNTEGVFLGPTSPETATIRVIAGDINSDGIPGYGDSTDQDFALTCYNCVDDPGFTLEATPDAVTVCAPDDAVYELGIGRVLGFVDPVTLAVSGAPAGAVIEFSTNPVVPPGDTVLTITGTVSVSAGVYEMLVEGNSAAASGGLPVVLTVYENVPGGGQAVLPQNGAVDVSRGPLFEWADVEQAAEYEFELALDHGFVQMVASTGGLTEPSYGPGVLLDPLTEYFWRVRGSNLCGSGAASATFTFTTGETLPLLLVDDDDNVPDVRSDYTDALDTLGRVYDVWDTGNSDNEPGTATLAQYETVVWFTGAEIGGASGPGPAGETALASFLDGGGCVFISSQSYHADRGLTGFMSDYLGVAEVGEDVRQFLLTGAAAPFDGMENLRLTYAFANESDRVSPNEESESTFIGNGGDAAVAAGDYVYLATFWGFPWEAVTDPDDRLALMTAVLDWCSGPRFDDCNNNDTPDAVDISEGTSDDCNANEVPDECDVVDGTSPDDNENSIPDECEILAPAVEAEGSRYIAVTAQPQDLTLPLALWLTGDPTDPNLSCLSAYVQADGTLDETPVFQTPSEWGTLYLSGEAIVPSGTYHLQEELVGGSRSEVAGSTTYRCGDVDDNGEVDIDDILYVIRGFQSDFSHASLEATDVAPCVPDGSIDIDDVLQVIRGFQSIPYDSICPMPCGD